MYQRDWLMRQIEQAGAVLAAILGKLKSGDSGGAIGLFEEAYRPLLGIGAKALPFLSDEALLALLRQGGVPDDRQWPVLVRLLVAEAEALGDQGAHEQAIERLRRALLLMLDLGGDPLRDPSLAETVGPALRAYRLDPATVAGVATMYERAKRFAEAEDTYYDGIEVELPDPVEVEAIIDAAVGFYRRLLERPGHELVAGGLPREEVEAGLAELLNRPVGPIRPVGPATT